MLRLAVRRRFVKGDILFHEGDPGDTLHMLVKGFVAVRVTTLAGETATLTVLRPTDFFGEQALLSVNSRRTASVIALGDVETMTIDARLFSELRSTDPSIDRLLADVLSTQVRRLSDSLVEALYSPVDERVKRRLSFLADAFGESAPCLRVEIPITQEELSTMAGTTRPAVNRILHELVTAGLVELARGRIVVTDRMALAKRAR